VSLGYLTILTNVRCYYHIIYNNFIFQEDGAPGASCIQHSLVELLQCKTLNFLSREL